MHFISQELTPKCTGQPSIFTRLFSHLFTRFVYLHSGLAQILFSLKFSLNLGKWTLSWASELWRWCLSALYCYAWKPLRVSTNLYFDFFHQFTRWNISFWFTTSSSHNFLHAGWWTISWAMLGLLHISVTKPSWQPP